MTTTIESTDLFSLPPLVLEKIELKVVIDMLRTRVNKGYMPSATGDKSFNRKPSFLGAGLVEHPGFPSVRSYEVSGYYCVDSYLRPSASKVVFANINTSGFQIMVNLQTCEAIVRRVNLKDLSSSPNHSVRWPDGPDYTLPINPADLEQHLEIYL